MATTTKRPVQTDRAKLTPVVKTKVAPQTVNTTVGPPRPNRSNRRVGL